MKSIFLLLLITGVLFLSFLGLRGLCEPDEGRYAEIAREMTESGDYFTPRLNYIKHFHKPPLAYWLVAASFNVFGQNEFTARLPVALLGIGGVLICYFFARRLGLSATGAWWSALVLATSLQYFIWTQVLASDMFFSFFLFLALAGLSSVLLGKESRLIYLFYLGMGLAFLVKGPVAVIIPFLVLLVYVVLTREWGLFKRLKIFPGLCIFLLIAVPWFVYVCRQNPGLWNYFVFYQSVQRLLTTAHGRKGGLLYFIPVLLLGGLPWIVFLPAAIKRSLSFDKRIKLFLLLWIIVPLVFFSLSRSKLPGYILPVYPALAVLIGGYIQQRTGRRVFALIAIISAVLYLGVIMVLPKFEERLGNNLSIRRPAQMIISERQAGDKIVNFRCFFQGLPFYLQEEVILVEEGRETQFEGLLSAEYTLAELNDGGRFWCFTPVDDFAEIKEKGEIPTNIVWEASDYVLFTNRLES